MLRISILVCFLSFFSCQSNSQQVPTESVKIPSNSNVLSYKIRPSILQKNAPLLVLLHGYGDNVDNFFSVGSPFDVRLLVAGIKAPQDYGNNRNGWYNIDFSTPELKGKVDEAELARTQILATIDDLITKHQVNPKQVYLLGFSQGTIMSLNIALTSPEKIKGALLFSGKLMKDLKTPLADKAKLKNLQIFLTHGKQDEVLLIQEGRNIHQQLKELGVEDLTYKEFEGPHTIPTDLLREATQWLKIRLDKK